LSHRDRERVVVDERYSLGHLNVVPLLEAHMCQKRTLVTWERVERGERADGVAWRASGDLWDV
jgi:hypothetical protein